MHALALADYGQVIGLQAQGQVAETEQADQQHGGGGQGFPVRAQAPQAGDFLFGAQGLRAVRHLRAVPDRLRAGEGLGVGGDGEPGVELAGLCLAGALHHDQPVQGLVHGACAGSVRRGGRLVGVHHGGPWQCLRTAGFWLKRGNGA